MVSNAFCFLKWRTRDNQMAMTTEDPTATPHTHTHAHVHEPHTHTHAQACTHRIINNLQDGVFVNVHQEPGVARPELHFLDRVLQGVETVFFLS